MEEDLYATIFNNYREQESIPDVKMTGTYRNNETKELHTLDNLDGLSYEKKLPGFTLVAEGAFVSIEAARKHHESTHPNCKKNDINMT